MSLFEKMKTAMADSAERRRQERDFVRAHNLKKDPEQKDRWWFADGRRYIDADLRDPVEREAAEAEIAAMKKRVRVRAVRETVTAQKKKAKSNDFELRPFDFDAPMPWEEPKKAAKKKA